MSLSDPIGDMIARIKNSQARKHKSVKLQNRFPISITQTFTRQRVI